MKARFTAQQPTVKNNTKFDGKNIPGEDGGKYFQEIISEGE